MIGKTFSVKVDGLLRTYEIVEIDTEGWIKLLRQDNNVTISGVMGKIAKAED